MDTHAKEIRKDFNEIQESTDVCQNIVSRIIAEKEISLTAKQQRGAPRRHFASRTRTTGSIKISSVHSGSSDDGPLRRPARKSSLRRSHTDSNVTQSTVTAPSMHKGSMPSYLDDSDYSAGDGTIDEDDHFSSMTSAAGPSKLQGYDSDDSDVIDCTIDDTSNWGPPTKAPPESSPSTTSMRSWGKSSPPTTAPPTRSRGSQLYYTVNGAAGDVAPMEGHLWKKNMGMCVSPVWRNSKRFFALRGSSLIWWKREAHAEQMLPVACIDLLADEVEVEARDGTPTAFELWPRNGTWKASKFNDGSGARGSIVLDAKGSEHSREEWIKALRARAAMGPSSQNAA